MVRERRRPHAVIARAQQQRRPSSLRRGWPSCFLPTRLILQLLARYDRGMSISPVYAVSEPEAQTSSALAIVASGQASSLSGEQAIMLNDRLKSELSIYKGVAATGFALAAGIATFALVQRVMMNQKLSLARAEGAAIGYTPRGQQQAQMAPYAPQAYGYPSPYYR